MTIYNCTLESIYFQLWVFILHSRKTDVIWYTKNKQNPQHKNVYKNSLKITKKYSEERQTMKWPELRRITLSIIYFFLGIGNGS
jgi:hypothetical protein